MGNQTNKSNNERRFNDLIEEFKNVKYSPRMPELLVLALEMAMPTDMSDPRSYLIGSVGKRNDSKIVTSRNGAVFSTTAEKFRRLPLAHSETRLCRKLDYYSTVYVGRISKQTSLPALSRPCEICQANLKAKKVCKVFYTINEDQYGVWYPATDEDRVFNV